MGQLTFKTNLVPNSDYGYSLGDNTTGSEKRWNFYGNLTGTADNATAWNGVSLSKTAVSGNSDLYLPCMGSTSATSANLVPVYDTATTGGSIARRTSSGYLISTTPSANDNSTKVATTAYVDDALANFTQYSIGTGLTLTNDTINHTNAVTAKAAAAQSAATLTWGGTFNIYEETYDTTGHVTGVASYAMTMPANPNTDISVNVVSDPTSKAYLLATTTTPTSTAQAVQTIADTGVYLDTASGKLHATSFNGAMDKVLTIGGKTYDGSANIDISVSDLGLSTPMTFRGISLTALTDGATTSPIVLTTGNLTPAIGDVVLDQTTKVEFVFSDGQWNSLGIASSYSLKEHWHGNIEHGGNIGTTSGLAVVTGNTGVLETADLTTAAPTTNGSATEFITSVSQGTNGKITATKAALDTSGTWAGNATHDGAGNTITSTYLPLAGGIMTGNLAVGVGSLTPDNPSGQTGLTSGIVLKTGGGIEIFHNTTPYIDFHYQNDNSDYSVRLSCEASDALYCSGKLFGAVWNDYAEFRQANSLEPGRCVIEQGDDTLTLSTERMQPGAEIISDTFGFAIGQTEKAQTPITTTGRVLAYPYEDRELFRQNIGKPVCSGPEGTVSIMTDEEYATKGYCAIGFISAVPDYEEWGQEKVKVNGRVWIRVR